MPITPTPKIWMNGELVDWDKAQIHVLTHTLHYGTGVFEGIRAYETSQGPAVFRLTDHIVRLHNSAKILGMELPYTVDELVDACKADRAVDRAAGVLRAPDRLPRLRRDGPQHAAVHGRRGHRLLAVGRLPRRRRRHQGRADEDLVVDPPRPQHDAAGVEDDRATTSTRRWPRSRRSTPATTRRSCWRPTGSSPSARGENIFVSRNGILLTPPLSAGALEGITQSSVMTIARDLGIECRVDNIARSDLYIAEEIFVCGTAAEVSSVNSVDDRPIPCPGPMTLAIAEIYARAVRGEEPQYKDWCELAVSHRTRLLAVAQAFGRTRPAPIPADRTACGPPRRSRSADTRSRLAEQASLARRKANRPGSAAAEAAAPPGAAQWDEPSTAGRPLGVSLSLDLHRPSCPKAWRAMPRYRPGCGLPGSVPVTGMSRPPRTSPDGRDGPP